MFTLNVGNCKLAKKKVPNLRFFAMKTNNSTREKLKSWTFLYIFFSFEPRKAFSSKAIMLRVHRALKFNSQKCFCNHLRPPYRWSAKNPRYNLLLAVKNFRFKQNFPRIHRIQINLLWSSDLIIQYFLDFWLVYRLMVSADFKIFYVNWTSSPCVLI